MSFITQNIQWLILGYLFGAIPFGLILTRLTGHGDIRKIGSGNIGATNVLRTGSKKLAIATVVADILKGTIPTLIAGSMAGTQAAMAAGFAAFIGHIYPVWLKFKGGKGVATYLGVLLGLFWPLALIFAALWLLMAFTFKISSLSALIASLVLPVAGYFLVGPKMAIFLLVLAAIIYFKHRDNIMRLLSGTESKIKLSSSNK